MAEMAVQEGALRSLLGLLEEDEQAMRLARDGGHAFVSSSLRPYLIAALAELDESSRSRPTLVVAGDDRAARDLAADLRTLWNVDFDDAGAIGRRYRRQDEIGTPFCVTVDFDTLEDDAVTIRERDSMEQQRLPIAEVVGWLAPRLLGS